jgi:hypothetical protein
MSSIRRTGLGANHWMLGLLAITLAAGCSTQEKMSYDPVNTKPIVGDDAMAFRSDWPVAVAHYQNGAVAAWSTRYPYQTKATASDTSNLILAAPLFLVETAALPVDLVVNPPFQPQLWYGVVYPPTYTAQPPLPPKGGMPPISGLLYTDENNNSSAAGYGGR